MAASITVKNDTLLVSGELDFESVLALEKQGGDWLAADAPSQAIVDLSGVTYSSSAGIALLLGWLRIARQQQKSLTIYQLPRDMAALAKVGGLEDLLASQ